MVLQGHRTNPGRQHLLPPSTRILARIVVRAMGIKATVSPSKPKVNVLHEHKHYTSNSHSYTNNTKNGVIYLLTLHPEALSRETKEGEYQPLKEEEMKEGLCHTLGMEGEGGGEGAFEAVWKGKEYEIVEEKQTEEEEEETQTLKERQVSVALKKRTFPTNQKSQVLRFHVPEVQIQ